MKFEILNPEIQAFINQNLDTNVVQLAFKKNSFEKVEFPEIINQIVCKSKAKIKLPTWYETENIIYPSKISLEQTSSEITAKHKARLVSGENLIDLTGGFGIDDYYFSKQMKNVIHCEINSDLSQIVAHNFQQLNCTNIQCKSGDSKEILSNLNQKFDWIYIDPSRRSDTKGKVFLLEDCLPNVPENLNFYFKYSNQILIKTAPIFDISAGIKSLKFVKKIEIIAVDNEVKELLFIIEKDFDKAIEIATFNYGKTAEEFAFSISEANVSAPFSLPLKYLYEPNSSVMKSNGFNEISKQFNLSKLHKHSHLYTSNDLVDFPGRRFEIVKQMAYQKSLLKENFEKKKFNITTRNFPETVENIRKKWKINDGGDLYAFFTTDRNEQKIVLICNKI